jgi:hypothetical protein
MPGPSVCVGKLTNSLLIKHQRADRINRPQERSNAALPHHFPLQTMANNGFSLPLIGSERYQT